MKVGVISDTHDNLPNVEKAIAIFNERKVGFVLHAGDYVAPFCAARFKKLFCDWRGVYGNNDGEKAGLADVSEGRIQDGPLRISLDGKKITLVHDIASVNTQSEDANFIIFGHTHLPVYLRQADKAIFNPGECGGWLTGKAGIAVLDLETSLLENINL